MKKAVIFVVILITICTGCSVKKVEELTDAEKFANEFNVNDDNPFEYVTLNQLFQLFESGRNVIFLADSDYEGSSKAARILLEVAKQEKQEKIYYYNPKRIEEKYPKKYKKLIGILKDYLENTDKDEGNASDDSENSADILTDENSQNDTNDEEDLEKKENLDNYILNLPDVYSVVDGKIVNHSNYFSRQEELSEEFLTKKVKTKIKNKYRDILQFKECTDCQ